jgi:hypothetical protein
MKYINGIMLILVTMVLLLSVAVVKVASSNECLKLSAPSGLKIVDSQLSAPMDFRIEEVKEEPKEIKLDIQWLPVLLEVFGALVLLCLLVTFAESRRNKNL